MPDHVTLDDLRERIAAYRATAEELAAAREEHGQGGPIYGIERRLRHLEERVNDGVRGLSPEDVAQQYEAIMGVVADGVLARMETAERTCPRCGGTLKIEHGEIVRGQRAAAEEIDDG